ncbi:YWFCY domain-containing protein [Chitinophaga sedimenti]|nr:YWFCY domain-containing protein [Chitinophaga sedimenti]MCK7559464.1 YWFCY domain-containing protein [Chitinophaga sedimenti]
MGTGENEQMLRSITDLLRLASMLLLGLHCYIYCYGSLHELGATSEILNKFLFKIGTHPAINNQLYLKGSVLGLLILALAGIRGKKM